jgi:phage terminase small subunit
MPRQTHLNKPAEALHLPAPPPGMCAAGRALWKATLACRPASEWSSADCGLLEVYVRAMLDVQRLDREIAQRGEIVSTPAGAVAVSPLVHVRSARERTLFAAVQRLRLAPSSRYTARRVGELSRHASKAHRAASALDADDDNLLATTGVLQ